MPLILKNYFGDQTLGQSQNYALPHDKNYTPRHKSVAMEKANRSYN